MSSGREKGEKETGRVPLSADLRKYLSTIGRRGGQRSRRRLDSETARRMVKVREARKAFATFRTRCFWSFDPQLEIGFDDIAWVVEQLRKNGDRSAWEVAVRLCR
jgi:hypothetical protein